DDLHERGGSERIHHMHGTLFQSRCVQCEKPFADNALYEGELPRCTDCSELIRPHIVWFGESPLDLEAIYAQLARATAVLVVGTSGSVYPAAGFVSAANQTGARTVYVGPEAPLNAAAFDDVILGTATEVLPGLFETKA